MAGCSIVFHTASPFRIGVTDPQKELVDPAVLGTRNVLEEANRTSSVQRVVLGPGINPHGASESFNLVRQFGDGALKVGVPDLRIGPQYYFPGAG